MSWLSSLLHPERGYEKAQEQLNNYFQQAQGNLQPYNQFGQGQFGNLNSYIQSLMNPQALQDKWASGYKESEAAKNLEGMAQQHGLDAASQMGLLGSSPALSVIQSGTSNIAAQDRQNYLDDLMRKYQLGAGLSQGIFGTGANAASGMSSNAMNMGQNAAQLAYGQQNAGGDILSKLLGGAVSFATPIGQAWGMNKLGLGPGYMPWNSYGRTPNAA